MDLTEAQAIVDEALSARKMAIIVGECSVKYHGRAASKLSSGERVVLIKGDGSFLVHQNSGLAAINYQPPKGTITTKLGEDTLVIRATRKKPAELLEAIFSKVFSASSFSLRDDSSLRVFGTEKNLSDLIMQKPDLVEEGLTVLNQESPLSKGKIDIFARDKKGNSVVIEVKRRTAGLKEVTQLQRYVDEVGKRLDTKTRGILCAPKITPSALHMLEEKNLEFCTLDYEIHNPSAKIRSIKKKQKGLGDYL
ncbi:MAG: endonuclease NucS [Candidatus Diapherotrites archaeon]|nr:endonuclease NucS [Candidatus Diapherotrites archaeon]